MICYPMKAKYISTPSRAKKIIATIWMAAISLSCVVVPFISGVSYLYVILKIMECLYLSYSTEMYTLGNVIN